MTALPQHQHDPGSRIDRIAWAKSLLLLGMGIYLAFLILTGNLTYYINLRFAWLAYAGTAIFVLLALVSLYSCLNPQQAHHHYQISWDMLLIVAFPLLLAITIPPRSLGIEAVNGGISLRPVAVDSAATFSRSPLDRNILDWLREFNRSHTPAAMNGQPVEVIGFVYHEPDFAEEEFMISRFTMSCCVADAYPIGMPVHFVGSANFNAGDWVRVSGELKANEFGGDFLPVVFASQIDLVEEPALPYLYP